MKSPMLIWRLVGWTVPAFLALLIPLHYYGRPGMTSSYTLGYLVSLFNIVFSLVSIQWAFRRKVKTFYAVVLGGMALRFILLAVMVYLVIAVLHWPLAGFLVSFVLFFLVLQYFEIRYINSELKGRSSANHDHTDS